MRLIEYNKLRMIIGTHKDYNTRKSQYYHIEIQTTYLFSGNH